MYRQLWLAIIISTLLALTGSLLSSVLSARNYLTEQLQMKNADNATVLALSLGRSETDAESIDLALAAMFDSGHYERIQVSDPKGKILSQRLASPDLQGAPEWFIRLLPINPPPGIADISTGWKRVGTVTLISHSRFAYRSLWDTVKNMALVLGIMGLISGYLGALILRRLRAPLNAVIAQAKAIEERRFITITEPRVPELRQLAVAMNATVNRLKSMFEEETKRLDAVRHEANSDPLTGLANRSYFMAKLRVSLEEEDAHGGTLILVRVADLAGINRRLGREATDHLLKSFALAAASSAELFAGGIAARLNGADFALLLPGENNGKEVAEHLLQTLTQEAAPFIGKGPCAYMGLGIYPGGIELSALLAQVDAALASAEMEGGDAIREAQLSQDKSVPCSEEEWSRLIHHALDQRWVRLISFPVTSLSGELLHRECPIRLMFNLDGEWQPAGKFLPIAERLQLTPQIDLAAITLGLEKLNATPDLPGLAINLSASSIESNAFRTQLKSLLLQYPDTSSKLWVEVSEIGAFKHFDAFRSLCVELRDTRCKLGLEHFGHQFSQIGRLHDLGLDYLKVDASFIRDIETSPGNQAFLKGLSGIVHGIGLRVFAEGVVSQAELDALAALSFDGATGPAIKDQA